MGDCERGKTRVHFLDLSDTTKAELKAWLKAAGMSNGGKADQTVLHCDPQRN